MDINNNDNKKSVDDYQSKSDNVKQKKDYNIKNNDDDDDDDDNEIVLLATDMKQSHAIHHAKPLDEHILSQKMSQLFTNTTDESSNMIKNLQDEINKIPDYLMKRNQSFKQMMYQVLSTSTMITTNNHKKELRKIVILIYKIMILRNHRLLWTTYLKAGMGQLVIPSEQPLNYSIVLSIWPKEMKLLLPKSIQINRTNENEICSNFINNSINELNKQLKQYEDELNERKNNFYQYTFTMQQKIEKYLEPHLSDLRMEIEHKVELIHYDYHIQALKRAYGQYNPNQYQKQLMKQLCASKYEQEITEQEFHLLQQRIHSYNGSSSTLNDYSLIPQAKLIDSIPNSTVRQQFFEQFQEITERAKTSMFSLYLKNAEEQRDESRNKLHLHMKKMWSDRRSAPDHEKIPLIMIQLIEQRCNKISESIRCIYKFKAIQSTPVYCNS